jgi:hypothetical protein
MVVTELRPGKRWDDAITRALESSIGLIVLLSADDYGSSRRQ